MNHNNYAFLLHMIIIQLQTINTEQLLKEKFLMLLL